MGLICARGEDGNLYVNLIEVIKAVIFNSCNMGTCLWVVYIKNDIELVI